MPGQSQSPGDAQGNEASTPTENIAPGSPLWDHDAHGQESYGQGYDFSDPVSLLKPEIGVRPHGSAITRFGKFGFKKSYAMLSTEHGQVVRIPILRTEGNQGQWTIEVFQDREPAYGADSTGVVGSFRTAVEDGFDVCRVDCDIHTLNVSKPGFVWDASRQVLSVTFENGETRKSLQVSVNEFIYPEKRQQQTPTIETADIPF